MGCALKSARRKCAVPLKWKRNSRTMPVRIYDAASSILNEEFFLVCRPNLRQNNRFRARHLVGIVEECTVRAIALHAMGSARLDHHHSAAHRGQHRPHIGEDDDCNKDKARQENRSRNDLHSAWAREFAGALDDDDYLAEHSRPDVVQLRVRLITRRQGIFFLLRQQIFAGQWLGRFSLSQEIKVFPLQASISRWICIFGFVCSRRKKAVRSLYNVRRSFT